MRNFNLIIKLPKFSHDLVKVMCLINFDNNSILTRHFKLFYHHFKFFKYFITKLVLQDFISSV